MWMECIPLTSRSRLQPRRASWRKMSNSDLTISRRRRSIFLLPCCGLSGAIRSCGLCILRIPWLPYYHSPCFHIFPARRDILHRFRVVQYVQGLDFAPCEGAPAGRPCSIGGLSASCTIRLLRRAQLCPRCQDVAPLRRVRFNATTVVRRRPCTIYAFSRSIRM